MPRTVIPFPENLDGSANSRVKLMIAGKAVLLYPRFEKTLAAGKSPNISRSDISVADYTKRIRTV